MANVAVGSVASAFSVQDEKKSRMEAVQRCAVSLVHASHCCDVECGRLTCHKLKRVIQHTQKCTKLRQLGSCRVCKQLIALCCFHGKECSNQQCHVPFCFQIKRRQREHQLRQRRHRRTQKMIRRIGQ